MNAYVDLSIIVFIIKFILSLIYSLIIFDKVKYNKIFILITFMLSILSMFINIFVINYFFLFFFILYSLFLLILSKDLMKVTLITLIIFYINYAYMLLIGGCFLYKGILMISTPFSVLFIFLVPIYITFIHLSISYIYKKIINNKFILKCIVRVDDKLYKGKGYFDSGNSLIFNDKPVIFINDKVSNNNGEIIEVRGINDVTFKYYAFIATLFYKGNAKHVYAVFISDVKSFNNCKFLLNKHIL